jgi:flavodoxin
MKTTISGLMRFALAISLSAFGLHAFANVEGEDNVKVNRTLVIYFSQPEDVSLEGVDAVSGASVLEKNQQRLGSTEYIAKLITQKIGADIYRIESVTPYPRDHKPLVDFAEQEKRDQARPAFKPTLPSLEQYDTVFLGYPIWWYQMPMILYSFLEDTDFSGKQLIPFSTHGGSRLSGTVREIVRLQPNADVETDAFTISRDDVADSDTPEEVYDWLDAIDVK